MAEFKLERFKYNWQGEWQASTAYKRDDVVYVGGKSYVCIKAHTSSSLFNDDLTNILPNSNPPLPDPYWVVMISSRTFSGNYTVGESYNIGEIVLYDGGLYECISGHAASDFAQQRANWKITSRFIDFKGNWQSGVSYGPGAVVKYNGISYQCENPHTSGGLLEENQTDWSIFHKGVEWRGEWQSETEFRVNDFVKFGGSIFQCIETHTSVGNTIDPSKFIVEVTGSKFIGDWSSTVFYGEGDIVRFGGFLYFSTQANQDVDPSRDEDDSTVAWRILAKTNRFRGEFAGGAEYRTGDIVQRGGYLYEALQDVNRSSGDASTLDYLNEDVWRLLVPGQRWKDAWQEDTLYAVGDVVYFFGAAYTCNFEHISEFNNAPGDNGEIFDYWDLLIQPGAPAGLREIGDLLTYGLSRDQYGDLSTLGDTALPIGDEGQVLSITEEQEVYWRNTLKDADTIYVDNNGVDDDGFGLDPYKPFQTVRFACEYVEDNFAPLTPVKISVATGFYPEIGPIVIPAGCAVVGDELRSTTIAATDPKVDYQDDVSTHTAIINHFLQFADDLILNREVELTPGNEKTQNRRLSVGSTAAFGIVQDRAADYFNRIDFVAGDGDTNPLISGSNTLSEDQLIVNSANILQKNIQFIIAEIEAFTAIVFPDEDLNSTKTRNDIRSFVRGIVRDIRFGGNYGTLRAANRYANAVVGSQLTDLFYCRDTTGVRSCTIQGLRGGLNPPGVFAAFQRPTGGACVSLDPGWGPEDERVWIKNRSPYIQGVTNIGTRCIGQKVDGSLHNGGNKSMVSNDFTQVLSDGIGAWITNNARAELVSIFTYYCSVGYLAENGGTIRSTQGNCSYGKFGAIATGNDETETPDVVEVFNRANEAQVEQAFAGGESDELFIFEYAHCGESYTNADADIVGAGADANVNFTDFRDGAVFEGRLINTKGSGSEGGTEYLTRSASAQITSDSTSSIRLSSNDETQFLEEIAGMRIIIESGRGVGQYGFVSDYEPNFKTVTVRRESDGELGWDHIIPGTPIESDLDSTSVYKIEPRLTASMPSFSVDAYDLPNARTIKDLAFGFTTVTYTNIELPLGTGETFDDEAVAGTANIQRKGSSYNVTITSAGAGYAIGDALTIPGNQLGGTTPANDLIIDVTEVSEDSTNSILDFTIDGTPRGGRYVAIADPNFALYSDDGINWTETNTSFVGNYQKIAAGNDVFVAIASNENTIGFSRDGETWNTISVGETENWVDIEFGNGVFVMIAEGTNTVVYSEDGLSWTTATIPVGGDSTAGQWQSLTYGQGQFLAVSGDANAIARSADGIQWSRLDGVLGTIDYDWAAVVYGDNRFLAVDKQGNTLYSLDKGSTWAQGGSILAVSSATDFSVQAVEFSQGIFFAIGSDAEETTQYAYTSEYGMSWQEKDLVVSKKWAAISYAPIGEIGKWVLLANDVSTDAIVNVNTGRQAKFRADVFTGIFTVVKIWDPGSAYTTDNPCEITVIDPNFVTEVEIDVRQGSGVLPQPDFINRGAGYRSSSSNISIVGNGFADIIPENNILTVSGVNVVPGPGVQIIINGILDPDTPDPEDLALFVGVEINDLGDDGTRRGTRLVRFTITPRLENEFNLAHGTAASLRSRYSQCRISSHDFLDIGTGNFEETNYPQIYAGGNFFRAAPENEVSELNGGRVFYTSTDQDGNFRVGELFGVDQATGIVTISAEFFDLDGLSQLALGGIRLGGSGAVVNEFSTDPTFSADSNNIVPTQRAIATFLADRLSVGGENLETNQITAGRTRIGGSDNVVETSSGEYLRFPRDVDFSGTDPNGNRTQIQGTIVGQSLFFRNDANDTMQ